MIDLLVIGAGVTGACIAREAALSGLSVALVERDDFGSGASANSLKILHGGLRDLRRLAPAAVRAGAREQAAWARSAPHLVQPLPFLLPTYPGLAQSRTALRLALAAADLLSPLPAAERLGGWRILGRAEARALVPDLPGPVTGGGLWHEGQMYSAERLVLEVVKQAVAAGAVAANHTEATALLRAADGTVAGARVRDALTGVEAETRAGCTVIATGATTPRLTAELLGTPLAPVAWSLAMNVVLPDLGYRTAFALRSRPAGGAPRQLLFVPWRGRTLLGTGHYAYEGDPAEFDRDEVDPGPLLAEANGAWDGPRVDRDDVLLTHAGLLPLESGRRVAPDRLLRDAVIRDHAADGDAGLISVLSVRFSYARRLAESVLDVVLASLGEGGRPERRKGRASESIPPAEPDPLPGGAGFRPGGDDLPAQLPSDVRGHLARCYGSEASAVLTSVRGVDRWDRRVLDGEPVIFGQFVHGARAEMARTVDDLVWRRTEIGPRGLADETVAERARAALAIAERAADPRRGDSPERRGSAAQGTPARVADGVEGDDGGS